MDDRTFAILERMFNSEQISWNDHQASVAGLSTSEAGLQNETFNLIVNEKFITSSDPYNTRTDTKYIISDIGKRAYLKERDRRDNELRQRNEDKIVETLQMRLLQANITMSQSVIDANKAAIANYRWQKRNGNRTVFFIGLSALFSLASIGTALLLRDKHTPKLLKWQAQSLYSIKRSLQSLDSSYHSGGAKKPGE